MAVTWYGLLDSLYYFGIVGFDYLPYAFHTTVAYFKGILIKDLMESVSVREMFFDETQERSSYIGFHVHGIWRIVPDYLTGSGSSGISLGLRIVIHLFRIPASFQRSVEERCSFVENVLVRRMAGKSFGYGFRNLL